MVSRAVDGVFERAHDPFSTGNYRDRLARVFLDTVLALRQRRKAAPDAGAGSTGQAQANVGHRVEQAAPNGAPVGTVEDYRAPLEVASLEELGWLVREAMRTDTSLASGGSGPR